MSALDEIDFTELQAFQGVVYRMHNPEWAFAPLSGKGAQMFGGRFNPEGEIALYTSTDVMTAYEEASDAGITPGLVSPMMLVSYQANLTKVLDLRPYKTLFEQPWELICEQYISGEGPMPQSWEAFHRAKATGAEALLAPSYQRASGNNLVLLSWNRHTMKIHDPDGRLASVYGDRLNLTED